ncbi:GNAT family N-acetyltransferase [Pseudoflavonifractor phocaeensis]|uniref:GNAT family N-acetyltransferase n=1 Tax=Pseudoflavonifractor phocaeensis TaxID=1870988 RepID=UPI00210B46D9|nr:GNAT family N-acetyltransferase [Pseudoflavonifractor phocaeensis]MCQ4863581.1 GNAT family N-acetyltransferase [Pseudoflavonifractor phocaeensis]
MNDSGAAAAYLDQNPLFFMDMREILRRGSGTLLFSNPQGVLLYDTGSGAYFMSARSEDALDKMLPGIPERPELLVGHERWYLERLKGQFGFDRADFCVQSAWMEETPPDLPDFDGELRFLGPEWAETVYHAYSHAFGGVEYIRGAIERGMLGLFADGALAGFVGFHDEGTIGMLEILPPYRRRGYGEVLLRAAVSLAMEQGKYPFGQIFDDNTASLALQKKVGMTVSEERLFWLTRE